MEIPRTPVTGSCSEEHGNRSHTGGAMVEGGSAATVFGPTLLVSRFMPHHYWHRGSSSSSASLLPSNTYDGVAGSGAKPANINRQLLTTITLIGVLYANCIGSGYGFEDSVGSAGPLVTLVFSLLIPWIWCLPTGLAVSELATAVKSNSGVLMWVNVAFHPVVSFMCVLITVFITFVGNASYPTLAADYIDKLIPLGWFGKAMVKLICVTSCALLNISGVELVGSAAVIISFATLAPFLIFTAKQLLFTSNGLDVSALSYVPGSIDWPTFLAITSWSFANIENAGTVVEEVANPKKTMVGAMVPLMLLTYPAYFFPVAAGVSALGPRQDYALWRNGYWATVAEHICGPWVKWMLLAGSVTTSFGFTLTSLCCTSRNLEGMGAMDIFPMGVNRFLTYLHPRWRTPVHAILLNAGITSFFCLALEFESIVALCQTLYCIRLLFIYAAVLKLRVMHPTLPRPYMLPCGVLGCALALAPAAAFSVVVAVACTYHDALVKVATFAFLLGGFACSAVYVAYHRPRGFRGQVTHVPRHSLIGRGDGSSNDDDDGDHRVNSTSNKMDLVVAGGMCSGTSEVKGETDGGGYCLGTESPQPMAAASSSASPQDASQEGCVLLAASDGASSDEMRLRRR